MFAYCRNNPVMRVDTQGTFDKEAFDIDGDPTRDEKDVTTSASTGGNLSPSISNITQRLQQCAKIANSMIKGNGPVAGTLKHSAFKSLVKSLNITNLQSEASYLNQTYVEYGKKGSIRFDVVLVNKSGRPIHAWDFKSGNAKLSSTRKFYMQQISGYTIPIDLIK